MDVIEKPLEGIRLLKMTKAEVQKIQDAKKIIKAIAFYVPGPWAEASASLSKCIPAMRIDLSTKAKEAPK